MWNSGEEQAVGVLNRAQLVLADWWAADEVKNDIDTHATWMLRSLTMKV